MDHKASQYFEWGWFIASEISTFGKNPQGVEEGGPFWFTLKGSGNEYVVSKEYSLGFKNTIFEEFGVTL